MFKVTRYYVETARGGGSGPFRTEREALAAAAAAARRGLEARVCAVTGEPVPDLWDAPVLIAIHPAMAAGPERLQKMHISAEIIDFTKETIRQFPSHASPLSSARPGNAPPV